MSYKHPWPRPLELHVGVAQVVRDVLAEMREHDGL